MWPIRLYRDLIWWKLKSYPRVQSWWTLLLQLRTECMTRTEVQSRRLHMHRLPTQSSVYARWCCLNGEWRIHQTLTANVWSVQSTMYSIVYCNSRGIRTTKNHLHILYYVVAYKKPDEQHPIQKDANNDHYTKTNSKETLLTVGRKRKKMILL